MHLLNQKYHPPSIPSSLHETIHQHLRQLEVIKIRNNHSALQTAHQQLGQLLFQYNLYPEAYDHLLAAGSDLAQECAVLGWKVKQVKEDPDNIRSLLLNLVISIRSRDEKSLVLLKHIRYYSREEVEEMGLFTCHQLDLMQVLLPIYFECITSLEQMGAGPLFEAVMSGCLDEAVTNLLSLHEFIEQLGLSTSDMIRRLTRLLTVHQSSVNTVNESAKLGMLERFRLDEVSQQYVRREKRLNEWAIERQFVARVEQSLRESQQNE